MFSTKEESAIEDLMGIVHELLGMVQADAEIGDERWEEASAISERVETIESLFRRPQCDRCGQRNDSVFFGNGDADRYLCTPCAGDVLAEEEAG